MTSKRLKTHVECIISKGANNTVYLLKIFIVFTAFLEESEIIYIGRFKFSRKKLSYS